MNNDPVNYVDLWGLLASEPERSKNIFSGFVDTVKGLFKDDDSKQIFTYGLSASATGIGISVAVFIFMRCIAIFYNFSLVR